MSEIPQDRRYARTHEWARQLADGNVEVGISDHAQQALGDLVFVELPEVGRVLSAGEGCAVVESVKAASDVYSPVAGTVVEVNAQLAGAPELVNQQPYAQGWLLRLRPAGAFADADLLDARAYAAVASES
ncbi:MAG: glycine cleavage system protein GcvH [Gammaproteobacteria bacterium]|nr:glycine cleavage system protein GcvH [Gammaproteobacteria bacterium]